MHVIRLIVALWYGLVSTPAAAVERLIAPTKVVASADFPCARHDCGCRSAEQCRLHCCCRLKSTSRLPTGVACHLPRQEHEPREVRVSYRSALDCSGNATDSAMLAHSLGPHLPVRRVIATATMPAVPLSFRESRHPSATTVEPPDKIPISSA
jgi:hypothetical protein